MINSAYCADRPRWWRITLTLIRPTGYDIRMKANQIVGGLFICAGVVCFYVDTIDKSDWKLAVGGIALVLFGLWAGKFNFRRDQGK